MGGKKDHKDDLTAKCTKDHQKCEMTMSLKLGKKTMKKEISKCFPKTCKEDNIKKELKESMPKSLPAKLHLKCGSAWWGGVATLTPTAYSQIVSTAGRCWT